MLFRAHGSEVFQSGTKRSENSPRRRDVDGHQVFNEILLTFPQNEREQVFPKLEFLRMKARHVLHEPGDTFKSAYFCNTGLISIFSMFPDSKSVEAELIGKEGFVGVPLVAGFRSAVVALRFKSKSRPVELR